MTAAHISLAVARPPRLLQQPLHWGRIPPGSIHQPVAMMLKLAKLKVLSRNLISRSLALFSKWWLTLSNYVFRLLPWCMCVCVSLRVCVGEKRPGRPNNTANGKSLRGWRRVFKWEKKNCVKRWPIVRGRSARLWSSDVTFHTAVERNKPERSTFEGSVLWRKTMSSLQNFRR